MNRNKKVIVLMGVVAGMCFALGCDPQSRIEAKALSSEDGTRTVGSIERKSAGLDDLVSQDAKLEVIASGFDWSEGPVWVAKGKYLLFSDIPPNKIHKWKEGKGLSLYLKPSGYTGSKKRAGEVGSNGLLVDKQGRTGDAADEGAFAAKRDRVFARREDAVRGELGSETSDLDGLQRSQGRAAGQWARVLRCDRMGGQTQGAA